MTGAISAVLFLDQRGKPVLMRDFRCAVLTASPRGEQAGHDDRSRVPIGPRDLHRFGSPRAAAAHPPPPLPCRQPCLAPRCRGDVPLAKVADRFMAKVNELEEAGAVAPVILDGKLSFIYVQYSNLYVLALTQTNVNAAATLVFLHKLIEIFKHYFTEVGGAQERGASAATLRRARTRSPPHHACLAPAVQLEEESLRDNFVIAYELLDEVMDHGYVQASWQRWRGAQSCRAVRLVAMLLCCCLLPLQQLGFGSCAVPSAC